MCNPGDVLDTSRVIYDEQQCAFSSSLLRDSTSTPLGPRPNLEACHIAKQGDMEIPARVLVPATVIFVLDNHTVRVGTCNTGLFKAAWRRKIWQMHLKTTPAEPPTPAQLFKIPECCPPFHVTTLHTEPSCKPLVFRRCTDRGANYTVELEVPSYVCLVRNTSYCINTGADSSYA